MAKFQIFSDLHLEHPPWLADDISFRQDVESVLLSGDIASGTEAFAWIVRQLPAGDLREVLYLSGNQEPYGHTIDWLADEIARTVEATGVGLLAPGVRDIADVRVISATLWTDYTTRFRNKAKETASGMMQQDMLANSYQRALNDFQWIRAGGRTITTGDVLACHAWEFAFIEAELARAGEKGVAVVVMTYHAPLRQSIAVIYDGEPMTSAFVSDLDAVVRRYKLAAWAYGHTHSAFAYRHSGCLMLCNPAGYHPRENSRFDPDHVLEVDPVCRSVRLVKDP